MLYEFDEMYFFIIMLTKIWEVNNKLDALRKHDIYQGNGFYAGPIVRAFLFLRVSGSWKNLYCKWIAEQRLGQLGDAGMFDAGCFLRLHWHAKSRKTIFLQ